MYTLFFVPKNSCCADTPDRPTYLNVFASCAVTGVDASSASVKTRAYMDCLDVDVCAQVGERVIVVEPVPRIARGRKLVLVQSVRAVVRYRGMRKSTKCQ